MYTLNRWAKDIIKLIIWYPLRSILPFLPLRTVYLLGKIGGNINFKLSNPLCKAMDDELSIIFNGKYSDEEKKSIIRRTIILNTKNQLEVLLFKTLNKKKTNLMIAVKGLEKIDSALSREKGVVLLIAHFGSNRLVMPALGFRGYKINQVAGKPTEWIKILGNELSLVSRKILELEHENEQHLPANFIYVFRSMRPIFNCLKNNEIVCVAIDGGGGIRKEKIKFLGREAMISDGPFRIARKTGATILPAFIVRQQDDSHRLIIEDAILAESNLSKEEDNSNGLNNFMNILEQYVDQYPCHYALRLALGRMLMEKDPIPFFTDYKKEKTL